MYDFFLVQCSCHCSFLLSCRSQHCMLSFHMTLDCLRNREKIKFPSLNALQPKGGKLLTLFSWAWPSRESGVRGSPFFTRHGQVESKGSPPLLYSARPEWRVRGLPPSLLGTADWRVRSSPGSRKTFVRYSNPVFAQFRSL